MIEENIRAVKEAEDKAAGDRNQHHDQKSRLTPAIEDQTGDKKDGIFELFRDRGIKNHHGR